MYAERYPNASPAAIKQAILNAAIPTPSMNGKCVSNGRLNLAKINQPPVEPATLPLGFSVSNYIDPVKGTVVKNKALLKWQDAANETSYELWRSTSSSFFKNVTIISIPSNVQSYVDSGLTGRSTYYYRLRALGPGGNSGYTPTLSFSPP